MSITKQTKEEKLDALADDLQEVFEKHGCIIEIYATKERRIELTVFSGDVEVGKYTGGDCILDLGRKTLEPII